MTLINLAFAAQPMQAAVTEAWVRYDNMGRYANDQAYKAVRDAAGNIIVTGSGGTIKYSGVDGTEVWRKQSPSDNRAAAVDAGGNVVVAGYSAGVSSSDYYTAKYAVTDGALLWEKRYNGPANQDDFATAVAVDGGGNVIVTGYSRNGVANFDYYTAKYAAADGALLWEKRYNGPANSPSAVAVDPSGNVVVTGTSGSDYYTAKYAAADGALLWERRYNGPANDSDYAFALSVDSSGNVVVTGSSYSSSAFPNYSNDFYTAKYAAANGVLLWEKRYSRPGNRYAPANAVAVDSSGNVIMTGCSDTSGGNYDYYTAKYAAANGALLWEKRYNGSANRWDLPAAVTVDASDNVVVTGVSDRRLDDLDYYDGDYYTAKYAAPDGALIWERRYQGPAFGVDQARSVVVDASGDVVVTGSSDNGHSDNYYTAKYAAADGTLLWENRYGGFSSSARSKDRAKAVAVDGSGNVVITGSSHNGESYDYYTAKYAAASGALLWRQRYDGPSAGNDYVTSMAVDRIGNVAVTGWSEDDGDYTAKYAAADGALLWEIRHDSFVSALAIDGSGNVVVTGSSEHGTNFYTAKYAAADGALLWEKRYQGYLGGGNSGVAIVVDTLGNVIVTGTSDGSDNAETADIYTAKYAATDGALLWERRYNGPANNSDGALAVAVDGNGNVAVTGFSYNGTNDEYYTTKYTAKYASANGALLWEKRYNENSCSEPTSMTVDSGGNVLVTGTACNGTNDEYYTAKFAAADGALLWEKRYHGPNSQGDYATGIAVDASGNAVVTGNSYNNSEDSDYYTAKYAAADGALIWEERYGGSFGHHFPAGVAVGPNGMVAITGTFNEGDYGDNITLGDYLTIVYRENLLPVSIAVIPTGVRLRFSGTPGHSYKIERAPAVTGPWSTRTILAAPSSGVIDYMDTNAPPGSAFYRTSTP